MANVLWRLVHPRSVCGIVVRDGVVVEAAPYVRRMCLGRRWSGARAELIRRGWHGAPVEAG